MESTCEHAQLQAFRRCAFDVAEHLPSSVDLAFRSSRISASLFKGCVCVREKVGIPEKQFFFLVTRCGFINFRTSPSSRVSRLESRIRRDSHRFVCPQILFFRPMPPMCVRRVKLLVCSIPLHRHTYIAKIESRVAPGFRKKENLEFEISA